MHFHVLVSVSKTVFGTFLVIKIYLERTKREKKEEKNEGEKEGRKRKEEYKEAIVGDWCRARKLH